jgi:hypothetical protein
MGEMALRVHCEGREPKNVMVTPDTTVEELTAALTQEYELPAADAAGPIRYVLNSKDSGRVLNPANSVAGENLRSGENLFLRRVIAEVAPSVANVHRARNIPLWLLAILGLAAIAGAYTLGHEASSTSGAELDTVRDQLRQVQQELQDRSRQLIEAQNQVTALKEQLENSASNSGTQLQQLKEQASRAQLQLRLNQQDNQKLSAALAQKSEALTQSQQQASQLNTELQSLRQQLQTAQNELSNKAAEIARLENSVQRRPPPPRIGYLTWTGKAKKGAMVQISGNHANVGTVGGTLLPGSPCSVVALDPLHVALRVLPGPANNWNQLMFEVNLSGETTVTLKWVAQ